MAYHNSTPATVLAAPTVAVVYLVHHSGPNRADRRHWRTVDGALRFIPKRLQAPAYNEPYVKSASGRA